MGELFALGAATCWAGSSILFAMASRQMGAETVNRLRLVLALLLIFFIDWLRQGRPIPAMSTEAFWWLFLSGFIGFALGDAMLFAAYVHIGASHAMLMMTLAPVFSAAIGWVFLQETLSLGQIAAILTTLVGIALVIVNSPKKEGRRGPSLLGLFMGTGAACGQAVGLLFSKKGMLLGVAPFEANGVRLLAGALSLLGWGIMRGRLKGDLLRMKGRSRFLLISFGTLLGPVIGVTFSLLAVKNTHMALAATLMGLTPVIMLPLMRYGFGERYRLVAVVGTVLAVLGAALLFWL